MSNVVTAVDLFCGAGGTSTGLFQAATAAGKRLRLTAINHWPTAIETHHANHEFAEHLCESLDGVDPRKVVPEGKLDILLASPECTHHSVARGGKPINDQSRATAWHVVRWADALRPKNLVVENVPEFEGWGPIGSNGLPLVSKRGEIFSAWIAAIQSLGYTVEWKVLTAADYGGVTTRRRLFVRGRFDGGRRRGPIKWPVATHSKEGAHGLFDEGVKPWRAAREVIDWSLQGRSIFDPKVKLAEATLRRICAGAKKYWGMDLEPFLLPEDGVRKQPYVAVPVDGAPFLYTMTHGGRSNSLEKPFPTITGANRGELAVIELDQKPAFFVGAGGPTGSARPRDINRPMGTVLAEDRKALVDAAFLVPFYGERAGQAPRTHSVEKPLPVIPATGNGKFALVDSFVMSAGGPECAARPVSQPIGTILTRDHRAVVEPILAVLRNNADCRSLEDPVPTITAGGRHLGLAEPFLMSQASGGAPRTVNEPMPTIVGKGGGSVASPFFVEYYGNGGSYPVTNPMRTITTKDRNALIEGGVTEGFMLDIRFRMLQPHELAKGQGFPDDYIFKGNRTEQIKQIGNAVEVNQARALCAAILEGAAA